jgi:hypothetical protein
VGKTTDLYNLTNTNGFFINTINGKKAFRPCQSLLGIHPILSYIDTRKLLFLQKLCSLDDNFITKRIFMTWLFSYFAGNSRKHFGFPWRFRIFPHISKFNKYMNVSKSKEIIVRRCKKWPLVLVCFIYSTINDRFP